MTTTNTMLDKLFKHLDHWRHLPSYQLERRADILFSIYLPEFFSEHFHCIIKDKIIPEFPVKLSIIYKYRNELDVNFIPDKVNLESNHSIKIDYVLLTEKLDSAFLVELKTDIYSINEMQSENLYYTGNCFAELIKGITDIYCYANISLKNRYKYNFLMNKLDEMGLFKNEGAFIEAQTKKYDTSRLISIVKSLDPIKIKKITKVYIVPSNSDLSKLKEKGFIIILFKEFLSYLGDLEKNENDYLATRFYQSLVKEWDKYEAGKIYM